MKTPLLLSLFLSLTSTAFADGELPVENGVATRGYDIAPVLKCPAVPEAYAQMITKLNVLKTQIKKDAACEPVNAEVQSLESLLGAKRDEVKALIEKSKKEALGEEDLAKIRSYVEEVTKKVLSTAELFNRNNYCFAEDKKNLTFADLASITLDATALAKTVAGPWATPIALGGQALAGIFQGLNTVMKNRRGYDYTNLEQRQAYVQSLCAYYNYRQDIEYLLYPNKRAAQLHGLEGILTSHLQGVVNNCPECADLATKVVTSLKSEPVTDKKKKRTPKPTDELNAQALQINQLYVRPLGTYTVKTLSTLKWISNEVTKIADDSGDDANIGRDFLSEIKVDIDRFMFEKEAPNFVMFQSQKSYDLFREFHNYVSGEGEKLQMQTYAVTNKYVDLSRMSETDVIKAISALEAPVRAAGQTGAASRIADYRRKSLELYERTRLAASVTETYCNFFQRANVYNGSLQTSCDSMYANAVRKNLKRLEGNEFIPQPILPESNKAYVTDWVDSLSKVIQQINADPDRYKKKNEIPRP